ncbi:hypothetical protein [Enterococcus sp. DIV1059_2]|uniref:hypothetical protein n=1 Tax=Enterococcus sp. DIV1059_2 TaxID=2774664 RepID=UPI003F22940C
MKAKIYGISKTVVDILNEERIDIVLSTENGRTVIDGGRIMTNSVTAGAIAANSILARHIVSDSITGDKILAGEITVDHLKAGTILLPDTEYGGVIISTRGLTLDSLTNTIVINSHEGMRITNKKSAIDILSINPETGDISLNVSSLNIQTVPVATTSDVTNLEIKVESKVNADEIIASFNLSKETAKLSAARIDLNGHVTFSSFDDATVNSLNETAQKASSANSTVSEWKTTGKTTIDGGKIEADSITGNKIKARSITAEHLIATAILLPDTSYGGVKITTTGLVAESTVSKIYLDSTNGFKITNKKNNTDVFSVNPSTGDISMNVSSMTIGASKTQVATRDDVNNAITTNTSYTDSKFKIANDSISLQVKESVDSSLGKIAISGRNIWATSKTVSGYVETTTGAVVSSTAQHRIIPELFEIKADTKLIYQVWNANKIVNSVNSNRVAFFNSNQQFISNVVLPFLDGSNYQVKIIDIPATAAYVRLGAVVAATPTQDPGIKIKYEFATMPTDWSQAPEDVDKAIENSTITAKSYTDSQLTIKADEITAGVSSLRETSTALGINYFLNSDIERTSKSEFLNNPSWDMAPLIDKHGMDKYYTVSFDLKSQIAGPINVYSQNGSATKYQIGSKTISATTEYVRYSYSFRPMPGSTTDPKALLAFYGTYDSGRIPSVKNIKFELGNAATIYTKAPEDNDAKISDAILTAKSYSDSQLRLKADEINLGVRGLTTSVANVQTDIARIVNMFQDPTFSKQSPKPVAEAGITVTYDSGGMVLNNTGTVKSRAYWILSPYSLAANKTYTVKANVNSGGSGTIEMGTQGGENISSETVNQNPFWMDGTIRVKTNTAFCIYVEPGKAVRLRELYIYEGTGVANSDIANAITTANTYSDAQLKIKSDEINLNVSRKVEQSAIDASILLDKTIKDTRSVNQSPQWYQTTYPKQKVEEFKTLAILGLNTLTTGTYCKLETDVPWNDASGGKINQTAFCDIANYQRFSTSTTAWSAWVKIADQADITTALSTAKSYTDAQLSIKADEISLGVVSSINNLSTSNRNLLGNTGDFSAGLQAAGILTDEVFLNGNAVFKNAAHNSAYKDPYARRLTVITDKPKYVLSFYAKSSVNGQAMACYFYSPNTTSFAETSQGKTSTNADGTIQFNLTTTWQRYWVRWTQSQPATPKTVIIGRTFASASTASGDVFISSPMLVEGTIPTEWAAAPEDSKLNVAYSNSSDGSVDFTRTIPNDNLLTGTAFTSAKDWIAMWNAGGGTFTSTADGKKIAAIGTPQTGIGQKLGFEPSAGEVYTISFQFRGTGSATPYFIMSGGANLTFGTVNATSTTTWQTYTQRLTFPSRSETVNYFGILTNNTQWIEVKKRSIKLERSTTPSIYTPSPSEDQPTGKMKYIGYSPINSNNYADYNWNPNPSGIVQKAYSDSEDGTLHFTKVYPNENILTGTSEIYQSYSLTNWGDYVDPNTNGRALPVTPGDTYTGTVYLKASDADVRILCRTFVNADGTGTYTDHFGNTISANTEGYSTVSFTVPASRQSLNVIAVRSNSATTPTNTVQYKELKLEEGLSRTIYTPSPVDDPVQAEMQFVGTSLVGGNNPTDYNWVPNAAPLAQFNETLMKLTPEGIFASVSQSTQFSDWKETIESKPDKESVDALTDKISGLEEASDIINTKISEVTLDAGNFQIDITDKLSDATGVIADVTKYMMFDNNFLTIGEKQNKFKINITNTDMKFLQDNVAIATITGNLLQIDTAEISSSIKVGNHKIEKFKGEELITVVRYDGNA